MIEILKKVFNPSNGNCLFNSIAAFIDRELYLCKRDKKGKPISKRNQQKETFMAKNLRQMVCFTLESMKDDFKEPFEYDDELYKDMDDRISSMKKNFVWGGMPELTALAKMLNIEFTIYVIHESKKNIITSESGIEASIDADIDYSVDAYIEDSLDCNDEGIEEINLDESGCEAHNSDEDSSEEEKPEILNEISIIGKGNFKKCNLLLDKDHYKLIEIFKYDELTDSSDSSDLSEDSSDNDAENAENDNNDNDNDKQEFIEMSSLEPMELESNKAFNVRFKNISIIDGIMFKGFKEKQKVELMNMSFKDNNSCGFYVPRTNAWFFYDNKQLFKSFCEKNNIEWI